jgi:hypothetical protein
MFKPINRVLGAALLSLAVIGPTVAQARFDLNPEPTVLSQSQRVESVTPHDGFRWSDAGIGAAGVLILLCGGIGASGAVRRRRSGGAWWIARGGER